MLTDMSLETEKQPCLLLGTWYSVLPDAHAANHPYEELTTSSGKHSDGSKSAIARSWYD